MEDKNLQYSESSKFSLEFVERILYVYVFWKCLKNGLSSLDMYKCFEINRGGWKMFLEKLLWCIYFPLYLLLLVYYLLWLIWLILSCVIMIMKVKILKSCACIHRPIITWFESKKTSTFLVPFNFMFCPFAMGFLYVLSMMDGSSLSMG